MNGTPRLRSAFPSTPTHQPGSSPPPPKQQQQQQQQHGSPQPSSPQAGGGARLPDVNSLKPSQQDPNAPLIPFSTVDAPTQRFYVVSIYTALMFWRLWDFYHLTLDEAESLWLFMKWVSIDGVFLFGLPGLRIPWLEWSPATMTMLFLIHAIFDGILMFRIPIPFGAWLAGFVKVLYNREIAVSERRVKPGKLMHDASSLLGDAITINILPEGSAILNPENIPLCLNTSNPSASVEVHLQINQTNPTSIELERYDLASSGKESIIISSSEIKKLRRTAEKATHWEPSEPLVLTYPLRKTGLYRLTKVMDETNMEVQRRRSEALVVACPSAKVVTVGGDRCRGDLSNMAIEVLGTPPLKIRYRKTVNGDDRDVSYSSIQPEEFVSPLQRPQDSLAVVNSDSTDLSWAAAHRVLVPINETLEKSGVWTYSIGEVTDALSNTVSYVVLDDFDKPKARAPHSEGSLRVHDRPTVALLNSVQNPIRVAEGDEVYMPVKFGTSNSKGAPRDVQHRIRYQFVPSKEISADGETKLFPYTKNISFGHLNYNYHIKHPGLYTIQSVSTQFCAGEVLEPWTCMLENPPRPQLSVSKEVMTDQCAGRPVGARVSFDFVGTPPFRVTWEAHKDHSGEFALEHQDFNGHRGQREFKPQEAGHYTYKFVEMSDKFYKAQSLKNQSIQIEQEVRPSVSALLLPRVPLTTICPDTHVSYDVRLAGENPFVLEWEVTHAGKRQTYKQENINDGQFRITTDKLSDGGDYILTLKSVRDRAGCQETLQQEARIAVRHQRPRAAFGKLEGKRSVRTLDGKSVELPVRLSGDAPWQLRYKQPNDNSVQEKTIRNANDFLSANAPGTYELVQINDAHCPGNVDDTANHFDVVGIPRPSLKLAESPLIENNKCTSACIKKDVCEGAEDSLDILLNGRPPFTLKYEKHIILEQGQKPFQAQESSVPLHSAKIKMDTTKPGVYEYKFTELGDYNYDHDAKHHNSNSVKQRVNSKPTASFTNPGKVYSFCQGQENEASEEVIQVTLTGQPPFTMDIEIKHNSRTSRATTHTIPNILTHAYDLRVPHAQLQAGNSFLSIRRVRDSLGCERQLDTLTGAGLSQNANAIPRVQISVHDPPTITPAEPKRTDYCIGDRISYTLSGLAPFTVYYDFGSKARKATSNDAVFRRLAESAGNFTITGLSDAGSSCRGTVHLAPKIIHPLPSVKVSQTHGRDKRVDIHAGGEAEILFEFSGTPPFEFTFVRSETKKGRSGNSAVGKVLETKTLVAEGMTARIKAGDEGTYEVVGLRDAYCGVSRPGTEGLRGSAQGVLTEGAGGGKGVNEAGKKLVDKLGVQLALEN